MKLKKIIKGLIGLVIIAGLGWAGYAVYRNMFTVKTKTVYTTQPLTVGPMQSTISATGTVEPEELVNVGAQVGGMITTLGQDATGRTIDYGSRVTKGMVLARIDDSLYQSEFEAANAQLLQAVASKKNAEAGVIQAQAKLDEAKASKLQKEALFKQAKLSWDRAKQLRGVNSQSEYESAEATFMNAEAAIAVAAATVDSCAASLASAKATIQQSEAQIASAKAALSKAKRNLGYCVITSPVDGVIIDRRVNVGQTVNSSMSAPSLFLIAKDLRRMQVWVSVNEADIGQIKVGQKVVFTVDAFQGRHFDGIVQKIRLNATMSQNVVTFVVEIGTDNSSNTLLPYLTANVKFILDSRDNVLSVPNAALRYTPADLPPPPAGMPPPPGMKGAPAEKTVWVLEKGDKLRPVKVKTGLNNGMNTEIVSGDLTPDMMVVTGSRVISPDAAAGNGTEGDNPFLAKMPPPPGKRVKK